MSVTRKLNKVPSAYSKHALQRLLERSQRYFDMGGIYILSNIKVFLSVLMSIEFFKASVWKLCNLLLYQIFCGGL